MISGMYCRFSDAKFLFSIHAKKRISKTDLNKLVKFHTFKQRLSFDTLTYYHLKNSPEHRDPLPRLNIFRDGFMTHLYWNTFPEFLTVPLFCCIRYFLLILNPGITFIIKGRFL